MIKNSQKIGNRRKCHQPDERHLDFQPHGGVGRYTMPHNQKKENNKCKNKKQPELPEN